MNRVVITGMGVVSPLGNDIDLFKKNLLAGKSGIKTIDLFAPESLESKIAGQCNIDDPQHKDRKIDFAILAADNALDDAGKDISTYPIEHRGLSIGLGLELFDMHDMTTLLMNDGEIPQNEQGRIDYLQTPADLCVEILQKRYQLGQTLSVHISACAAGSDAIGHGMMRIRRGQSKMMLAGGTDSMLNPLGLAGFCKLNALSTRNNEPEKASRPFDATRDGFVLGEGAGFIVLENLDDARKRRARIYAEIVGYGNSFDAYSISEPHPEGQGAVLAIQRAIEMAGIPPNAIDYINAHGTSTQKNDPAETFAIKTVFGEHAYQVPISSTKSMTGHLIAASGAVEAVAATVCVGNGFVPPTINLGTNDPLCDLDYVPNLARYMDVDYYLSNSFAFGGQNAALVFKNWKD